MYRKPNWSQEGRDWPLRGASQFVEAAGLKWHVQRLGKGPSLLLIHGTGAATHSWHQTATLLAHDFEVISFDLPGHGFTQTPSGSGLSLPGMAQAIGQLIGALRIVPVAIIGHSAGSAIGAEIILSQNISTKHLISINGAFKPFDGLAAHIFPAAAKLLVLNPITIFALAAGASKTERVQALMDGTGSKLNAQAIELYRRLFACPGHVAGVMGMMARWELEKLVPRLGLITTPTTLIVGSNDQTIPPTVSKDVAQLIAGANYIQLAGLGHLAHEEDPETVAKAIKATLQSES